MKKIIALVVASLMVQMSHANTYSYERDRVFVGASIPIVSNKSKPTWFWDSDDVEYRKFYRLPREATDAKYDGNGYIAFKLRDTCFLYNLINTFTYQVPCARKKVPSDIGSL